MFNWRLIRDILAPDSPSFPGVRLAAFEELTADGATMGTLFVGRQGTGKTTALARHLVDSFKRFPDRAIFVLDWSGSISDAILTLINQEPKPEREVLLSRVVYDEMGHPEWVTPMPEFSHLYGSSYEEQAQRLGNNLAKLAPELVADAPFLAGLGIREIAPQLFRLLTTVSNEYEETWQATEAKKLLAEPALLKRIARTYGYRAPQAKWFFERTFLPLPDRERELRTYAVTALLGAIETTETRARVGYYRPAWTPREAIRNGLLVLVNGARLINQRNTQHYLFTQVYSLIMAEINKRVPGDSNDRPVSLVMDEVYSLLSIPGMAEEIGMLSPLYRSRKLEIYIVLQALSQLAETLREQIWSIGNIVCFGISNFDEAYQLAQQIFRYNPETVKLSAKTETQQPVTEPDRGQYLQIANDIQRMRHRECVVRRYLSERLLDKYVLWVSQTKQVSNRPTEMSLADVKEKLLKERGVRLRDALEAINQRKLAPETQAPPAL